MPSEPGLYQELEPTIIEGIVDSFGVESGDVAICVEQILDSQVPVERCKHGNIDPHLIATGPGWADGLRECPGAGIGVDNAN